ncbi:MAG TPA: hypothetical protein VGL77_19425 [Armatimonadota bacterium]
MLTMHGAHALILAQQGNQLLIDGQPATLTFARGCQTVADLPMYRALGFNTLLVTADSPGSRQLTNLETLADAAAKAGLFVLVELTNGVWSADQYADMRDKNYAENATYFLNAVIPRLSKHPNVVGWVISTADEAQSLSSLGTFVDYLKRKYGTVENLKDAWSDRNEDGHVIAAPPVTSFALLTVLPLDRLLHLSASKAVNEKIIADVTAYQGLIKARNSYFQAAMQQRYQSLEELTLNWQCADDWQYDSWDTLTIESVLKHAQSHPLASPQSMLALARFQLDAPVVLMDWWAKQLALRDPGRLVFAGGQHSYRTIISLPHSVNGVLTECYPGYAEADLEMQNPHAIDMARRGNQFIVLAGVQAHSSDPAGLASAMYTAAVHGAAGICITDWAALRNGTEGASGDYAATVHASLADMQRRDLLGRAPLPTIAIVYSPYAPGPRGGKRAIYGYLPDFLYPGPGMLFFYLRGGTRFGQFDYLAADDLTRVPLTRYQTILLPSALDVPEAAQRALLSFVQGGGTVVADIGAGTVQANGNFYFLPEGLMNLFHVVNVPGIKHVRQNLEVYQPHARFPSLHAGLRTNGIAGGYMIAQAVMVTPLAGAQLLFSTVEDNHLGKPTVRARAVLPVKPTYGVFANQFGLGYAVYAPFALYQLWLPGNWLFGEFHQDLFSRGASVALQRPIDFIPSLASVSRYADGSVFVWTRDQTRPEVEVSNSARRLYDVRQGHCELGEETTRLCYDISGFHVANPLPIWVKPTPATVRFVTNQIDRRMMDFDLEVTGEAEDRSSLTLRIGNGLYPVTPNSRHRLLLTGLADTQTALLDTDETMTLQADAHGVLIVNTTAARCRVRLIPLDAPPPPAVKSDDVLIDLMPEFEVTPR